MVIKVNYNENTGEILGYYPDDILYPAIPEPYIEVDEATHLDCVNNQYNRMVDIKSKVVMPGVIIKALAKEEQLRILDLEYESQFTSLSIALGLATLSDNPESISEKKTDYVALKAEYDIKRGEING